MSKKGIHFGWYNRISTNYIVTNNMIPSAIIVGSRGDQVTIGKIWESVWRGPTIIINAGCLVTKTYIPKEVMPIFITTEHDYFRHVNRSSKVKILFDKYKSSEII